MKIGKFETIGYLGGGNFGKVFRAEDQLLDKERAIKIIPVQNGQQFIDAVTEAQILEKCRHDHIVDIKEINLVEINGVATPCIVMEYLKKGSVHGYLENTFVTVHKACEIITQVLFGLEHAHNQGISHRDIKPGNILFGDNGQAKLSDFGLAYGLANQPFNFAGYSSHLPPEVLKGVQQDSVSDLYSLGITFYRLLNNLSTFELTFADDAQWLKALEKERFPLREYDKHIPERIRRIVNKSIRADRHKRFQNCLDFRQTIQVIPLAIEWFPISVDKWNGYYQNDNYEIEMYKKRTGYFIDFKRNGRKLNERSFIQIPSKNVAEHEFFQLIRDTTISI